jgi:uncharacterized protein YndB with AHSA1/START domain
MTDTVSASSTITASAQTVFAVLADPATHPAIDGTGWVREYLDTEKLAATGQIFRMAMYHQNHPDGHYQMANRVEIMDPPHLIAWKPGQIHADGNLQFGGWIWRYDLTPTGRVETEVTLTYDWSAVPQFLREHIPFPPFGPNHLRNSLTHLAKIAASYPDSSGDGQTLA